MGTRQNNFAASKTKNIMMLNSKSIGNKIATARKKINLSQAELAQQVSISSQAVGKWERGESLPDITTLNRLAEILGVDLNYFSESFQSEDTEVKTKESSEKQNLPAGKAGNKLLWDMSQGNWENADFSGLKNLHEKFSSSNLKSCKFIGSELSGLLLKSNNVDSCDFSSSDISSSQILTSNLHNNIFKSCSLNDTEFLKSYIMCCDFSGADFTGTVFKSGGFQNNQIANSIWNHTSFKETQIINMIFEGILEDCYFDNCDFNKVTFQNVTFKNSFFKNNKRLNRVKFINCQADRMTYEFLKGGKADLTGISLLS
jgi:transcriptional regulator with XRE-family HTH domain